MPLIIDKGATALQLANSRNLNLKKIHNYEKYFH